MMLLMGRELDRPRPMEPRETLLSAAWRPVELKAVGELRRLRIPMEKHSHIQNVDVLGKLPCSGHCCFPLPPRWVEIAQLRRPRCSHGAGIPDFTPFVVLVVNELSPFYDWYTSWRYIVCHSPEELCSIPGSADR